MVESIEIPIAVFRQLMEDSRWLQCLRDAGLDNWQGIEMAQEEMVWDEDG